MTKCKDTQHKEIKEALKGYESPTGNLDIKDFGDIRFIDGFEQGYRAAKEWNK